MAKTKIICTIGPSVNSYDKIVSLIKAGMNVARLNFSHGTHEDHLQIIESLKKARQDLEVPLAIMLDTKGPEIRLKKVEGGKLFLPSGHKWILQKEEIEGSLERASISPGFILDKLKAGDVVLFDDGNISAKVIEKIEEGVVIQIDNGGEIKSGKGVNIPEANLEMPAITEQDIADIRFGCRQDVDIIAASFVRSAEDVQLIRNLLIEENKADILLIGKIENKQGVENFDKILKCVDGIMIARGDLGVQLPLAQVPRLQKMMIKKCYLAGKLAVTATQMLESMINNPRPTRAEVSDVANAIYDSSTAVMLSGETAIGKYPIYAVQMMKNIIRATEGDFSYFNFLAQHSQVIYQDIPSAVTLAAVKTAHNAHAKCIFAFTNSGSTARLLSRLRPPIPIIALTSNPKSYYQMAIDYGVMPVLGKHAGTTTKDAFEELSNYCLEAQYVAPNDLVVITAGVRFGVSGSTNTMLVETIGEKTVY